MNMIRERDGKAIFLKCDVSKEEQVKNVIEKTVDQFGCLDYAFNNSGVGAVGNPMADMPEKD